MRLLRKSALFFAFLLLQVSSSAAGEDGCYDDLFEGFQARICFAKRNLAFLTEVSTKQPGITNSKNPDIMSLKGPPDGGPFAKPGENGYILASFDKGGWWGLHS